MEYDGSKDHDEATMRGPQKRTLNAAATETQALAERALYQAFAALRTADDARRFLADIATPAEIEAFAERWRIAQMLDDGGLSYRDIAAATGASTTTVARVARFLTDEQHGGYRLIIDRLRGGKARRR